MLLNILYMLSVATQPSSYTVDPAATTVAWRGTKALGAGSHEGIVRVASGTITMNGAELTGGTIVIDMRTIEVTDIPASDPIPRARITEHLSGEEFFHVAMYPTAVLRISSATHASSDYTVRGTMTIRGVTQSVQFRMRLEELGTSLRAVGTLTLDRKAFGVSFGGLIRNQLVDNDFTVRIALHATPPTQDCDACGPRDAPARLTATYDMAPPSEPGEKLVIRGTVFEADGRTPAPGVLVYAYQTNAVGVYPKRGNERAYDRWHGYLRGWVRTDANGRYEFRTIRPGMYPTRAEPAHIHMEVQPRGSSDAYYISDIVAADDPLVDAAYRSHASRRGGSGVSRFQKDSAGVWQVRRNITLDRARY